MMIRRREPSRRTLSDEVNQDGADRQRESMMSVRSARIDSKAKNLLMGVTRKYSSEFCVARIRRRSLQLHRSYSFLLTITLMLCIPSLSIAEDESQAEEEASVEDVFDDDTYYTHNNDVDNEEWYMVLVFSLFFGFFITLFGAFIGYFSALEDSLMRRYKREGTVIFANVASTEFARGGGQVAIFTKQRDNPEYIAFCEYNCKMRENYTVRIRKQLKARQADFSSNPRPGTEGMLLSIRMQINREQSASQQPYYATADDCCGAVEDARNLNLDPWQDDPIPFGDVADRQFLELLLLPDHERSAYPRKQVDRACSIRYRLSTIGLVAFDLALAAFCTRLAANDVLALEHGGHRIIGWYAIASFLLLILLEVPLIHYFCHDNFVDSLREEYLESGDYIPLQCDDSSLSSGSDMYLSNAPQSLSASINSEVL